MKTSLFASYVVTGLCAVLAVHPVIGAQSSDDGRNVSLVTEGGQRKTVQQGRRVALLIGNSNYSKLKRLDNPKNDVVLMETTLRELGFTEIVGGSKAGLNLNFADMQELLEEFAKKSHSAEVAVIFFAGHGVVSKGSNEQYLAGVETTGVETRLPAEAMSITAIMDKLNGNGAQKNFVFLDACRESARGGGMRSVTPKRDAPNTVILYATAADDVAADGKGKNSPFTSALAAEMKQPNEWAVVQRNVIKRVLKETEERQEPKPYGSLRDEMYFNVNITVTPSASAMEIKFWESIQNSNDAEDFKEYLKKYPNGEYAGLARNRINRLQTPSAPIAPAPQASPAPVSIAPPPTPTTEIIDKRYQILANGAEVKDLQTNLIWQRCHVGMNWNGNTCTGKAKEFTFDDAQKQAGNDWRVPTIRELSSLIYCSSGKMKDSDDVKDGGAPIKNYCDGEYTRPTINTKAFPNTPASFVWSGSPNAGYTSVAWSVHFNVGNSYGSYRGNGYGVRLVRGGQ